MKKEQILEQVKELLISKKLTLSSAESCTGGLISSYLTDISGSSAYIEQNFVTYSNEAKTKFLNVKKETLDKYGAVSEQTAYEMSLGLLKYADCSLATTGILGPTGGSKEKPIGLVYISMGYKNNIEVIKYISKEAKTNDRYKIKKDIVEYSLIKFIDFLKTI
ncbi:MAG: CinA family protein [Candidatus Gastranaerophilales bacterium]|nr:CinA family protein [Candidatus Gastranaerophilales bacterium]